jgi:hypothetical protein
LANNPGLPPEILTTSNMIVKIVVEEKPLNKKSEEEKTSSDDYKYVPCVCVGRTRKTRLKRFRVCVNTSS